MSIINSICKRKSGDREKLEDYYRIFASNTAASESTSAANRGMDSARFGTIWTVVIAMSIYHVVVYGVNQMMVQRTLVAGTLGDAKKAYITWGMSPFSPTCSSSA